MASPEKWAQLVAKLIELTQEGKLVWEGPEKGSIDQTGRQYTNYVALYQDKYFRVRKHSGDFLRTSSTGTQRRSPAEDKYFLSIMDQDKKILYSLPDTPGFEDLFEAVVFQKAGIDKLLDDLLKE